MGNTVAKITSKIVKVTNNPDTRAFIGKIVTRKNTDRGTIYVIGSTGYALSPAEYKRFAEAGAIAQSSLIPKKKDEQKRTPSKATRAMSASAEQDIQPRMEDEIEFGSEEHHAMLETSEFLMNYPQPSFDLDTPKRLSLFDKKDNFKEKATGFFDRIGRKGRDKLVDAMSQE